MPTWVKFEICMPYKYRSVVLVVSFFLSKWFYYAENTFPCQKYNINSNYLFLWSWFQPHNKVDHKSVLRLWDTSIITLGCWYYCVSANIWLLSHEMPLSGIKFTDSSSTFLFLVPFCKLWCVVSTFIKSLYQCDELQTHSVSSVLLASLIPFLIMSAHLFKDGLASFENSSRQVQNFPNASSS